MRRSNLSSLSVIVLVSVAMAFVFGYLRVEAQSPVGSGFTYQGRMFDASNAPVQGLCDLSLRLYDHDSGGAQIGATVAITSVAMTDGYFDITPDFGSPSFNGEARWLEIESACPPGAGATTFPRQAINVVPYAVYALNSSGGITSTVYVTETVYYTPTYHLQGWETITGTLATYTPTAHTQDWTTITGQPSAYTSTYHLQGWETITGTLATYTPTAHTQDWNTIFGTPGAYTPTTHTQGWDTITGQPSAYTPTYHLQGWATITGTPSSFTTTVHDMITAHTYSGGNTLDVFGLSAASTITRITPSSNPGATANILASNSTGGLTLSGRLSYNESDWTGGNVIYVPLNVDIQAYVNAAESGDTIILASGTYIISSTITINKEVNIIGQGSSGFATIPATPGRGTLIQSSTPGLVAIELDSSNVRISMLSINLTGAASTAINTSNNLTGLVINNIDVIVRCSGLAQGFTIYGSDAVLRDSTFYIESTNGPASGVWVWNESPTTQDAVVDMFSVTGTVIGKSSYAYGVVAENANVHHTITLNASTTIVNVLAGTPLDVGIASISWQTGSPVTNNAIVNAYLCTVGGTDYDVYQNGSNQLNLGGTVVVNNRRFGTVTYRSTMASGTGVFGGTLNVSSGRITDTTGLISFGSNNLTTTGIFTHTQGWATITGQPGTYTPTAHTQAWSTITSQPSTYTATVPKGYIAYGDINTGILTGSSNLSIIGGPLLYRSTWQPQLSIAYGTTSELATLDTSIDADGVVTHSISPQPPGTNAEFRFTKPVKFLAAPILSTMTAGWLPYMGANKEIVGSANATLDSLGNAHFQAVVSLGDGGGGHKLRFYGNPSKYNFQIGKQINVNDAFEITPSTAAGGTTFSTPAIVVLTTSNVGIKTGTPTNFALQVAGNVGPDTSNTYDLGSASNYWATIHYHTLTSHSLSVFSTTVTLQNGKEVSCLDALKEIKADPSKKIKGVQHMDYATIPVAALNVAPTAFAPSAYGGYPVGKNGEDGADLDMMVSLMLCAEKELDAKSIALDNRMSDLEQRLVALELKVK
jgi:hypothetical protein